MPRMPDPVRVERARRAREGGALLQDVALELGVSVATVSRWCAGLERPLSSRHGASPRQLEGMRATRWETQRARHAQERSHAWALGTDRVGLLADRDRDLLAVAAYWSEGSKSKPWRRAERLVFTNSDPGLLLVWLAFLRRHGVPDGDLRLHLSIHERADLARATAYWAEVLGIPAESFGSPWLKRGHPSTSRHNTGEAYAGCLVVRVVQSRQLYQLVEAMWTSIAADAGVQQPLLADSTCSPSAVG